MAHFVETMDRESLPNEERVGSGLHRFMTGQPVFVLALNDPRTHGPVVLKDEADFSKLCQQPQDHLDQLAWTSVRGFFRAGGRRLVVLPVAVGERGSDGFLRAILGLETTSFKRSGFHALKSFDMVGDLLSFPQAAAVLSAPALLTFYQSVQATLDQQDPWFLLVDPPFGQPTGALGEWISKMDSACSALYAPWVTMEQVGFFAPSVLVSAFVQYSDLNHSVADVPANRWMPFAGRLLGEEGPTQSESDRRIGFSELGRCNRIELLPGAVSGSGVSKAQLWGNTTLSQKQDESRWIHMMRTQRALRDALTRITSAFVFEPKSPAMCDDLRGAVEGFLGELLKRGVLRLPRGGGPAFVVTLDVEEGKGAVGLLDAVVHLNVHVCLDSLFRRIGLYVEV